MTHHRRVLHMIGHAHIDPVWLWQWPEGYQEVRATFQSAVDRLAEYPRFVFTCDSVQFFEWVEESDPDLFEQIRRRVAEGRIEVAGGWWVERDCHLPGGDEQYAVFYGVGNHGGGPTKANLDQIERLNERADLPRLEPSSLRRFFDSVAVDGGIRTLRGELQHHSVGCYTSHSGIKRWNRRAENLLLRAEKWCAVADWLGARAYPHDELTQAWRLVLFNQFHDTLAGTAIAPAYEDARDQLGH